MKSKYFIISYVLICLFFSCVPHLTKSLSLYDQIDQELEKINDNRESRSLSLQRLEILRMSFNSPEEFEKTVTPLKSKISQAAKEVIDFSSCYCRECAIGALLLCLDIDKVFAFLSNWPIKAEDLNSQQDPFFSLNKNQLLRNAMSLAVAFPDFLDFGKAQPYLPALKAKFGDVQPISLNNVAPYQIFLLKTAVRVFDQVYRHSYILGGAVVGGIGYLFYTGIQGSPFFSSEKF